MAALFLWPVAASAQADVETDEEFNQRVDPEGIFDFLNCHMFSGNMNIIAVVEKDGETVADAIVAVYTTDGSIRGKDIPDPSQENQVFLTVYGDGPDSLVFKVYTGGKIYEVGSDLTFIENAMIGWGEPYVITLVDTVLPGDVNGDGKVSISDAVAVVNYILGQPSTNFNVAVADINSDEDITFADAVAIVNIILSSTSD